MKIFLSHADKDKPFVIRINEDLKLHDFVTWFDSEKILIGDSIVESLEKGLETSDVFILFLSRHSVSSNWVKTEWHTKFLKKVSESNTYILPILLDDCTVPVFLSNIRYLDFSKQEKYTDNLALLLKRLHEIRLEIEKIPEKLFVIDPAYSIYDSTKEILEELENEYIIFPLQKKISIIDSLKKIPRSGKLLRLNGFKPEVRIRTIYDHILSVAHIADCLLPCIKHGISRQDYPELARCIAFHEVSEVVLGDIPIYTPLISQNKASAKMYAEHLITVPVKKRKQTAYDFIWMFLNEKNKKSFEKVNNTLADNKSNLYLTFRIFDKIDPIIATWRYLHEYRGRLGDTPKDFNNKMKDFYENPDLKSFLRNDKIDPLILDLVNNLQDRTNAWNYYEDAGKIHNDSRLFGLPSQVVKNLIEDLPLFLS